MPDLVTKISSDEDSCCIDGLASNCGGGVIWSCGHNKIHRLSMPSRICQSYSGITCSGECLHKMQHLRLHTVMKTLSPSASGGSERCAPPPCLLRCCEDVKASQLIRHHAEHYSRQSLPLRRSHHFHQKQSQSLAACSELPRSGAN